MWDCMMVCFVYLEREVGIFSAVVNLALIVFLFPTLLRCYICYNHPDKIKLTVI